MSTASSLSDVVRRVIEHPTGGVIGLVDELLAVCPEHGLQLDWQAGRCRVRPLGSNGVDQFDVPLRKSVFRAILARVAALCNEQDPSSASPYGGQSRLSVGANPPSVFRVTITNTSAEQRLEVVRVRADNASARPEGA